MSRKIVTVEALYIYDMPMSLRNYWLKSSASGTTLTTVRAYDSNGALVWGSDSVPVSASVASGSFNSLSSIFPGQDFDLN